MKPLDRLSEYLGAIERRLRLIALTRGIAVTAGMALGLTIVAVLVINQFAFSGGSVPARGCSCSWAWHSPSRRRSSSP
jgi:hypothetical protein